MKLRNKFMPNIVFLNNWLQLGLDLVDNRRREVDSHEKLFRFGVVKLRTFEYVALVLGDTPRHRRYNAGLVITGEL